MEQNTSKNEIFTFIKEHPIISVIVLEKVTDSICKVVSAFKGGNK